MSRFDDGDAICPVCNNHSLRTGEYVDIGVGEQKVSPDFCDVCGYTDDWRLLDRAGLSALEKCWELQIDFWNQNAAEAIGWEEPPSSRI